MLLHQHSGRWQLGLALSLLTALLWGIMPNVLSIALQAVDTYTLTWFRFLSSFLLLSSYLGIRRVLRGPSPVMNGNKGVAALAHLRGGQGLLLILAILGVGLDYPLYLQGMARTSPANAEVVIQLAPVLMSLGAILIFKERYTRQQWMGVAILTTGFSLFFREQLTALFAGSSQYFVGSVLVMLAAVAWSIYALAQKQLLQVLPSELIMLVIYGACAVLYTPTAQFQQLVGLSPLYIATLIASGLSTLISYGAFAEALAHWEASKISAIQSLTPVITLSSAWVLARLLPTVIPPEPLNRLGLAGTALVIGGSVIIALGNRLQWVPDGSDDQP
ncbi:MAG: DMT family transporter [Synechococcales cyanobacterium C42_A2020_086]|jgi:drug/metabolite transporter (DMT)-like permease|nr:DMT family transporter [Synechococcales cyanobacterium C42_A2020_086]